VPETAKAAAGMADHRTCVAIPLVAFIAS